MNINMKDVIFEGNINEQIKKDLLDFDIVPHLKISNQSKKKKTIEFGYKLVKKKTGK